MTFKKGDPCMHMLSTGRCEYFTYLGPGYFEDCSYVYNDTYAKCQVRTVNLRHVTKEELLKLKLGYELVDCGWVKE